MPLVIWERTDAAQLARREQQRNDDAVRRQQPEARPPEDADEAQLAVGLLLEHRWHLGLRVRWHLGLDVPFVESREGGRRIGGHGDAAVPLMGS